MCTKSYCTINQLESKVFVASEEMASDTCVPSLIVIGTDINQLQTKVSLKTNLLSEAICCCLQTYNVLESKVMEGNTCTLSVVVIGTAVNPFCCYILPTAL